MSDCVVCKLKIEGPSRGMGDGAGQEFAHEDCYWRRKAAQLRVQLAEARAEAAVLREALEGAWKLIQYEAEQCHRLRKHLDHLSNCDAADCQHAYKRILSYIELLLNPSPAIQKMLEAEKRLAEVTEYAGVPVDEPYGWIANIRRILEGGEPHD